MHLPPNCFEISKQNGGVNALSALGSQPSAGTCLAIGIDCFAAGCTSFPIKRKRVPCPAES